MISYDVGRWTIDPRYFITQPTPCFCRAPHKGWQPTHTGLHEDDLKPGVLFENTFEYKTHQLALKGLSLGLIELVAISREASRTWGLSILASGMDANGKTVLFRGGI